MLRIDAGGQDRKEHTTRQTESLEVPAGKLLLVAKDFNR
jgi:hypothetical protein